jgi:hypothetical protein
VTTRNYWLDLFTWATWQEFLQAGAKISGFKQSRWRVAQQVQPGDYFLCYLTGVSRWIGALEVESQAFQDNSRIWKDEEFPVRFRVRVVVELTPDTAVPIHQLSDQLTFFQNMTSPASWTGLFRGSPARMKAADGEVVLESLVEAQRHPVVRPVDPAKLSYRPRTLKAGNVGEVTIPDDESVPESEPAKPQAEAAVRESSIHDEIQQMLLRLGSDMGLDVWVARNDRGKEVNGRRLGDLPRMKRELPLQFDEATNRTIELIDVLWLRGNAIAAAFEIESTTSIYSGLLRMADLIAMQPNLNIPLYLVAPDERRNKVVTEVNRPTFSRLSPTMSSMCRFIPFTVLRDRISQAGALVRYLRPEFLDEVSESCLIEND